MSTSEELDTPPELRWRLPRLVTGLQLARMTQRLDPYVHVVVERDDVVIEGEAWIGGEDHHWHVHAGDQFVLQAIRIAWGHRNPEFQPYLRCRIHALGPTAFGGSMVEVGLPESVSLPLYTPDETSSEQVATIVTNVARNAARPAGALREADVSEPLVRIDRPAARVVNERVRSQEQVAVSNQQKRRSCGVCNQPVGPNDAGWLPLLDGKQVLHCKSCTKRLHPDWFGVRAAAHNTWSFLKIAALLIGLGILYSLLGMYQGCGGHAGPSC